MSQFKARNNVSRNGFDLSKRTLFTAKAGELLPVYCKEVIPGDRFKINVTSFTRTAPLNTAAYTRIREYYDWYFVPTNLLWNKFNTFVEQTTDNVQHANSITGSAEVGDGHPFFTLESVYDYMNAMRESQSNSAKNIFDIPRWIGTEKLLDYLGYGSYYQILERSEGRPFADILGAELRENPALNPFPLLAYQKIYSDFYRNSQWESAHASSYNIDYLQGQDLEIPVYELQESETTSQTGVENMFDLRYANWHKDLFMGVLPNSQFGDAASVDLSSLLNYSGTNFQLVNSGTNDDVSTNAQGYLTTSSSNLPTIWNISPQDVEKISNSIGLTRSKLQSAFTVLALRMAEAKQKLQEIQQSNRRDYQAQVEAIFNVKPSDILSERAMWLKGFSQNIDINEVVNTNLVNGENRQAADIAGKGQGSQNGNLTFSSDVHGYIMCIYHAEPLLDYNMPTRIQRQNLKTLYTDYADPVLDKTGMVQLPTIEISNENAMSASIYRELLGYVPRYYDYKTDVDEVKGGFRDSQFYGEWSAAVDAATLGGFKYNLSVSWPFFKVNPVVLDSIFLPQVAQNPTYESDQFIINSYFDVSCVRNLDRDGLPY